MLKKFCNFPQKWILAIAAVTATFLFLLFLPTYASEVNILFEHTTEYEAYRGVTFRESRLMTERGMLDVHTIIIDLNEPYIELAPVSHQGNLGRRATTSSMLRDAGAIAGINADFFGMAGSYSTHFGPMVQDGILIGANTYTNHTYDQFATFFIGTDARPFIEYVRSVIRFYNNGRSNIDISSYNSIGHTLYWPVIVTQQTMYNTADLNRRFCGLTKIVVDGAQITYISAPGETVDVPRLGYVVVLPQRMAYRTRYFALGDTTLLQRANSQSINFADLQMAIGGGALLLENGAVTSNRGVSPTARHPRSAVGVSQDGTRVILMVADGRSHSIGATHGEMAYLMGRAGAHDAMHFDGGGSTTLVSSTWGENLHVTNTVADGSERRVINALGVFNRSEMGEIVSITAASGVTRAIAGSPTSITVYGEDSLGNRSPVIPTSVTVDSNSGSWYSGRYTPTRPGRHEITFQYSGFETVKVIYASVLAELVPTRSSINIFYGQRTAVTFTGLGQDGHALTVPTVERRRVSPAELGFFEGDTFVATGAGAGYIAARIGDVAVFFPIYVSGFARGVNMFANEIDSDRYSTATILQQDGRRFVRLEYELARSTSAQTARVIFEPIPIPGEPNGLRLQVYGEASGHGIRARVQDAEGTNHTINFGNANFYGWETVFGRLPNAPGPFTIDQVFMISSSWYELSSHNVLFYGLYALYSPEVNEDFELPESDRLIDNMHREFSGGTAFAVSEKNSEYSARTRNDFTVITMAANEGGIFATNSDQWRRFVRDARNLDNDNVLILIDANPVTFRQRMEFELMHLALLNLQMEGRNVFVASATGAGEEPVLTKRDGIRYINLPRPEEDATAEIRFLIEDGVVVGWM